jgi:hypothetical protein
VITNTTTLFICTGCGTQYSPRPDAPREPPANCPICDDVRQFVPDAHQRWTTLESLRHTHRNAFERLEPSLLGVGTTPSFAIGQRALLVQAPEGNVLWDCIALLDQATIDIIAALGGLTAIAISHPHYYTTVVDWAHAFGCPVLLHAADREWMMRPDPTVHFWEGDTHELQPGLTLVRCGGHFPGATVLHWAAGAGGRGALLASDILQVVPDDRHVSMMRSYPNLIPLGAAAVRGIAAVIEPFEYDRVYGAWWNRVIMEDGKAAVARSVDRYLAAIAGGA